MSPEEAVERTEQQGKDPSGISPFPILTTKLATIYKIHP